MKQTKTKTKTAKVAKATKAKAAVADARDLVAELNGDARPVAVEAKDYEGTLIASIPKNNSEQIAIGRRTTVFKGKTYDFVDIRIFYYHKESNTYRPSMKGLTVSLAKVGEVLTAFAQAAAVQAPKPTFRFPNPNQ